MNRRFRIHGERRPCEVFTELAVAVRSPLADRRLVRRAEEPRVQFNEVLNPWDVHSIEAVVAGGDGRQEVVGDKAPALK
jgi:hypothetical protein